MFQTLAANVGRTKRERNAAVLNICSDFFLDVAPILPLHLQPHTDNKPDWQRLLSQSYWVKPGKSNFGSATTQKSKWCRQWTLQLPSILRQCPWGWSQDTVGRIFVSFVLYSFVQLVWLWMFLCPVGQKTSHMDLFWNTAHLQWAGFLVDFLVRDCEQDSSMKLRMHVDMAGPAILPTICTTLSTHQGKTREKETTTIQTSNNDKNITKGRGIQRSTPASS